MVVLFFRRDTMRGRGYSHFRDYVSMSIAIPTSHSFLTTEEQIIDLCPTSTDLTVSEAATIMDATVGYIEELIMLGCLKYRLEGTQYWIDRDHFLEYKLEWDRRSAGLAEMMRWDQEMELYDMEFDLEKFNATKHAIRNANRGS